MHHPVLGLNFPGRSLVSKAISDFFSVNYHPKEEYRSQLYVMAPSGYPKDEELAMLVSERFEIERASRALVLTGNVDHAREFLMTGAISGRPRRLEVSYAECPLLYLILEICDSMLNMSDHCVICGNDLGVSGLKASVCDNNVCLFGVTQVGIGISVLNELQRDPVTADFLISLASSCYPTPLFTPKLPPDLEKHGTEFFATLPAISSLVGLDSDATLRSRIGTEYYEILRIILLSNRSHLIHLPPELAIKECADSTQQFLAVVAAPARELVFRQKKEGKESTWLWHGSHLPRWHSILHSGLRDFGRTEYRIHGGSTLGPGVYQSNLSSYSYWYAGGGSPNLYCNTKLPKQMTVLALVENVPGPDLNKVMESEYTQKDLEGLIVRCLMVVEKPFTWDALVEPPKHVPTLDECLSYFAAKALGEI
jgi:poly [ADP-ribose] polymerase 6/8